MPPFNERPYPPPPPPTVPEEDITEAAPFFNMIEEDDVENDIDID